MSKMTNEFKRELNTFLLDTAIENYARIIELIETENAHVDDEMVNSCVEEIGTLSNLRKTSEKHGFGLEDKIDEVETLCRKIIAAAK